MKEKPPYPKHSQDRTTGRGACAGWPTVVLASLLAGWPADAQPALSRWHSSSLFTSLDGPTVIEAWSPAPVPLLLCTTLHGALTLMGATRDGCFLGKTNVCEPPHLCHLPKWRAHNWPAGPALLTACLWALPMVARGQLGWCPMAYLVSGAAICPGCAFVPVPAGSALLLHTCPRLPRATSWSPAPALPFCAETLVLHLLLPSPLSRDCFGVSQWKDCRAPPSQRCRLPSRPVPQGSSPKTWS